jgi:DNA-binding XRE family transcriptional regulator
MLAVVKTPHTDLKIRGFIPTAVLQVLRTEYGSHLRIEKQKGEDDLIDVFATDLYKRFKKTVKPGDYVRTYRSNLSMSQADLGEKLGVSRAYICDIEKHRRQLGKDMAKQLVKLFHAPLEFFI